MEGGRRMITEPKTKLDYLLVYFEILTKTKTNDNFIKWNSDELQNVAKQIQEEINKLD